MRDMTLFTGRPEDKRIEKEEKCYDLLDYLGIEYHRVDHDYANTIEDCHEIEATLGCSICKNLLLTNRQMTDLYLLLMPGDKPFKTKTLSKQIGSARLSFASAEQMLKYLDITPGSLSIWGLVNDKKNRVQLLIDKDLLKDEYIGCHPCINSSSIRIKTQDMLSLIIPATLHEPLFVELPWDTE